MLLEDVMTPRTTAARAALTVAREHLSDALLNHSIRSWYWAVGFAAREDRGFDAELLHVAALLHDLGLTDAFENRTLAYEDAAGHVTSVLGAGAGWDPERRRRVAEVIVRHNWPSVDPALDVEGHLLETATALDISGRRVDDLPIEYRREVLAAHPRLDIAAVFGSRVTDEAARKPRTAAARIVAGGLRAALADHPLDRTQDDTRG